MLFLLVFVQKTSGKPQQEVSSNGWVSDTDRKIEVHDSLGAYYKRVGKNELAAIHLLRVSSILDKQGQYKEALNYLIRAEQIAKNPSDSLFNKIQIRRTSLLLALQLFRETDSSATHALPRMAGQKDKSPMFGLLNNRAIARVYDNRPAEALSDWRTIYLVAAEEPKYHPEALNAALNMGAFFGQAGNLDSSLFYSYKALTFADKNDADSRAQCMENLAGVYMNRKEGEKALTYIDSALTLAEEVKDPNLTVSVLYNKAAILHSIGRDSEAYDLMLEFSELEGSLYTEDLARAVSEMREKYESEKKAKEINALQARNLSMELEKDRAARQRNLLIALAILLLLAGSGLYMRFFTIRKKNRIIAEEKQRSEELLLNILPYQVAEELKSTGSSKARQFQEVTILFTDFVDFTKLAGTLTPTELVDEINFCFKAFDRIIDQYGIEKIKTIGDAYMAAGGIPEHKADSARNVLLAAFEMQSFLEKRAAEQQTKGLPYFTMRLGIHTGPVVAGIVGIKKFQYDLWGDTVNTAARMEQHSEQGRINISQTTAELLSITEFGLQPRGEIEVKGKGYMRMYFVEKLHPEA